jgi:DNA repair exonuclease SbcCD ATPase subunit
VEEALTLWTHIQDSHDAYHDAIAQNTARLQRDKTIIVAQLRESLAEMKALSVEAFSKVQEQEDTRIELVSRIDELEQQIETLSQQQREAVAASQADRRDKAHLTEQVLTLNGQLWSLNQQCVSLHRQTEQDSKIIAAANEELGKSKAWFRTRKDELTNELQDTASKLSEFAARCAAATLRIKELEVALQEAESANARNSAKIGECAVKIVEQERALHKASSDAVDISTEYKQLQQLLDQEQAAHTAAVEKLQQLLDQEQAAHTAAVEKTESLRREFLSADSTISALRAERAALHAQISELQASHHSSTQALQERVKQLQQLLDQEQAAHTAALVKTKSLRRDFLTADATISALGAQLSELQASHDSCTQSLQERNRECKILESVLAESCVNNFRDEEQAEAEMAPLRGHSPLVDAAISRFLLLSQLTSRLGACQQEMAQSLAASEEDRQGLLRKLDLIMNEYDRLRDEYVAREETATLSHKALQEKTTVKIINLENEAIELRAILAQVEQALGCPWPAFARMRLSQNPKASVLHLLARTDAANLDRMSSPQRTLSPVATANCSLCVPPPGFTLSEGAERAASATPQSISRFCPSSNLQNVLFSTSVAHPPSAHALSTCLQYFSQYISHI